MPEPKKAQSLCFFEILEGNNFFGFSKCIPVPRNAWLFVILTSFRFFLEFFDFCVPHYWRLQMFLSKKFISIPKKTRPLTTFCINFLKNLSRVMRHTKPKNSRKKQKVVKITKSHAFLGIYFETPKSCYSQVWRKNTNFRHF